jgi:hypothetical protein
MRFVMLLLVAALVGCAPTNPPGPALPQTDAEWAALNARNADIRRLQAIREQRRQSLAQLFGMEWALTRAAMQCDDPEIRRTAYAVARQQERYFDNMARTRPDLAQISAHEDTRATTRTAGLRPNARDCQRMLATMGESAKGMRDGDR